MVVLLAFLLVYEFPGCGYVGGMVNVDNFWKRPCLQTEARFNKRALIVAHAAYAGVDACAEHVQSRGREAVDAARYVFHAFEWLVFES